MNLSNIPEITVRVKFSKKVPVSDMIRITDSKDLNKVLRLVFNNDTFAWTEEIIMLCLNRANRLLGYHKVGKGGVTGAVVDPKVVCTIALKYAACCVVLAHNHPSGSTSPSGADCEVTKKLKGALELLDIRMLDHIILTEESYYSFADEGNL